jgi:hypothetical protein
MTADLIGSPRPGTVMRSASSSTLAAQFIATVVFRPGRSYPLAPTRANGQLALAAYVTRPPGSPGRSRGIDAEATRLREAFRTKQTRPRQLLLVEDAMGRQSLALLRQLDTPCTSADDLEQAVESFDQHPDAGIITSFPDLGPLTGARVHAETGDARPLH